MGRSLLKPDSQVVGGQHLSSLSRLDVKERDQESSERYDWLNSRLKIGADHKEMTSISIHFLRGREDVCRLAVRHWLGRGQERSVMLRLMGNPGRR